jgi:hypothetical protein
MAKTPTAAASEEPQEGLPDNKLDPVPTDPDPPVEPPVDPVPDTPYEQAVAFKPDPWDQLPEDQAVRDIYLALNGQVTFFIKRRA